MMADSNNDFSVRRILLPHRCGIRFAAPFLGGCPPEHSEIMRKAEVDQAQSLEILDIVEVHEKYRIIDI
jgi:hypothetical protein